MSLRKLLFIACLIALLHAASTVCAQPLEAAEKASLTRDEAISLFSKANDAYEGGEKKEKAKDLTGAKEKYEQAAQIYEKILLGGFENWQIRYNLGNVHYRLNQLGKAILNYRRALMFAPRQEEVKFNLQQAKREIRDKESLFTPPAFIQTPLFFYYALNINEATVLTAAVYLALCATLCLFIFTKARWLKWLSILWGACFIILGTSLAIRIVNERNTLRGVVMADKCAVRWAPGQEDSLRFEVHEGAEFIVEERKDDWYKARFFVKIKGGGDSDSPDEERKNSRDEAVGWIDSKDVAVILP